MHVEVGSLRHLLQEHPDHRWAIAICVEPGCRALLVRERHAVRGGTSGRRESEPDRERAHHTRGARTPAMGKDDEATSEPWISLARLAGEHQLGDNTDERLRRTLIDDRRTYESSNVAGR